MKLSLSQNPIMHVPFSSNLQISHSFSLPLTSISSQSNSNSIQFPRVSTAKETSISNDAEMPTMSEILEASKSQKLHLQLQTLGPFFRITARSLVTDAELGKAEGIIRIWVGGGGRILHLDSIKLRKETLNMEKSIFGLGLYIGAVAIRHGYDCGCKTAQLLAINDSDLYHSKLVRFYTRLGFKPVYEVTGASIGDLAHQLVWGGVGTRMDASVEELMIKWCKRFKTTPNKFSGKIKETAQDSEEPKFRPCNNRFRTTLGPGHSVEPVLHILPLHSTVTDNFIEESYALNCFILCHLTLFTIM